MFKIHWFTKLMMRFTPKLFFKYAAKKQGLNQKKINQAADLFGDAKRIDIQPLFSRSGRGFIIFLDNKISLHFYQDADHFYYDGFEIGEYGNGEVTVFDSLDVE